MANWYVNYVTGTDDITAGRGTTTANPFKTINFIVSRTTTAPFLAPGDTVYVAPGVYREAISTGVSGTQDNYVKLIADTTGYYTNTSPGEVVVTGWVPGAAALGTGLYVSADSWWQIKGFTFKSFTGQGICCMGSSTTARTTFVEIKQCKFDTCGVGVYSGNTGTSYGYTDHIAVMECEFTNCAIGFKMQATYTPVTTSVAGLVNSWVPNSWAGLTIHYVADCVFNTSSSYNMMCYYDTNSYLSYNALVVRNRVTNNATMALYWANCASISGSTSDDIGFYNNVFKVMYTSYTNYVGTTNVTWAKANVLEAPTYYNATQALMFASAATYWIPPTTGSRANLPPDAVGFSGDSNTSVAGYSFGGLYLEKDAPIQGTASGKLYGYVNNKYKWRIPADANQSLGIMLSAKRSWDTASNAGAGFVVFRLYDEAGILIGTSAKSATLQDDNFLHTVTIDNIVMPAKGFAILEVEIMPRPTAVLGDHVLIDDIQII